MRRRKASAFSMLAGTDGVLGGFEASCRPDYVAEADSVRQSSSRAEVKQKPRSVIQPATRGFDVVRPLVIKLEQEMMRRLDRLTLAGLCAQAKRAGIETRAAQAADVDAPQGRASVIAQISPKGRHDD